MKKLLSVILTIGLLTGCGKTATQEKSSEQPKKEKVAMKSEKINVVKKEQPGEPVEQNKQPSNNNQAQQPKQEENKKVEQTPQLTQKPGNQPVEKPKPQGIQTPQTEQKPEEVQPKPQEIKQEPEQPAPVEKPVKQEPVVPPKTQQQQFKKYVDSGHWTLTTNTDYLNNHKLYVYGVESAEENFVGNYVKRYIEQNIAGKPVTVTTYQVGNGIKTYKFSW
ncbi:hypothetical protein [Neobacillus citreus]|uniref:Lipoprotein n=1 Tax=Neobacillus citreus TaxID=2833578 RepID=A0A942T3S2_9BACI|nr:hypothetical protein [Neobacillus citreus]MCH6269016.1 hypothetical protein [Neobacillus citreus]